MTGMMREAEMLRKIADNIAVKVPLTVDGLKTCKKLTGDGTMVNVTLCFSANQALLAAKAGATFVSPFLGRLDDIGQTGMELIADIRLIYDNYDFATQILAASIRHPIHVFEAAKLGADVMTAPPAVIRQLFKHPLTDKRHRGVPRGLGEDRAEDRLTGSSEKRSGRPATKPAGPDHQANGGFTNSPCGQPSHVAVHLRLAAEERQSVPAARKVSRWPSILKLAQPARETMI